MINGMLSSVLLRILVACLFGMVSNMGLTGIGLAAPAATVGGLLIAFFYYKSGSWKNKELIGCPVLPDDFTRYMCTLQL